MAVLVILPAVPEAAPEVTSVEAPPGAAKLVWFGRLKNSARNSSLRLESKRNSFWSETSKLNTRGPMMVLRPTFPRVPGGGMLKAEGSKYRSGPPRTGLLLRPGRRLGRFAENRKPRVRKFIWGWKGVPLRKRMIPPSRQPPKMYEKRRNSASDALPRWGDRRNS